MNRPPLSRILVSFIEGDHFISAWTKEGFDLNAYKLMERGGYNFQNLAPLGKVAKDKPHGLTKTQRKIQVHGGSGDFSKVRLAFTPP